MKNKFLFFVIVFALLLTFSIVTGFSTNNNEDSIFTKSSYKSTAITSCLEQKEEKEVYVYITKTGKKYHKGNCRYIKKGKIKITLKEACKRGYTPCKVCKPPKCPEK